jgi:hypothetical protein
MIDKLICVCCQRDAVVWKTASAFIVQNIDSKAYRVIVPDKDVNLFKEISAKPFEIINESIYAKDFQSEIRKRLPKKISGQYGWYLQQFIKLAAAANNHSNEIVLIWDADTVPIKKINFISQQGKLNYYVGVEHHQPYFETIKRLLHLTKKVNFSFIAQCFVLRASWIHEFIQEIEKVHSKRWDLALLESIDFEEGNSFSEYETLGTFVSHRHSSEISYLNKSWLRLGNSAIGHPAFLSAQLITKKLTKFDFVSFEKWDRAKPFFWRVLLPYFLKVYIPKVCDRLKLKNYKL